MWLDDLRFSECAFKYSKDNEQYSIKTSALTFIQNGIVGLSGEGKSTILKILFGDKELSAEVALGKHQNRQHYQKRPLWQPVILPPVAEPFDADLTYNIVLNKEL